MKNNRNLVGNMMIFLVCICLGIMLSIQLKTIKKANDTTIDVQRSRDESLQRQVADKDAEIAELKNNLSQYQNEVLQNDQVLESELLKTKMVAGLVDVQGTGITITLSDGVPTTTGRTEDYLIHDSDVLLLVNELKTLGAEAIEINGQRIGPNTDIRCAGSTILINSEKVIPPLVIKAIGNSNDLETGIMMPGGVYDKFAAFLNMTLKKEELVTIKANSKYTVFKYATKAEEVQ